MHDITPINNHGSIQLKFTVAGKRYSFHPVPAGDYRNSADLATARAIASQIQNDRRSGHFDTSLDRYRLEVRGEPMALLPGGLIGLWDTWVDSLQLPTATVADHYEMVRRMILKATPAPLDTTWFTACSSLAASTYNKRLGYLRSCLAWAVRHGHTDRNPWADVKARKHIHQAVKPFSATEIQAILAVVSPAYAPFIRFLFLSGCRMSEAIGLTWQCVDMERMTLTVSMSMSVDRTGNGYQRVLKATKTGSIRVLGISPALGELLDSIDRHLDGLVFHSPRGHVVAGSNVRAAWVDALKAAGVPYRRLHAIRHTVLSMAVEQGTPLTGVAYLAGHKNTRMVMTTYGHMINRPPLPDMGL